METRRPRSRTLSLVAASALVAALCQRPAVDALAPPAAAARTGPGRPGSRLFASEIEIETETNPRLSGLALALDDGTRKSHSMAQNTAFVEGFFKGIGSPDSYKNLLTSLYYVYRAMEEDVLDGIAGGDERGPAAAWVAALDSAALRRLGGLEKDMEYFYGPGWKSAIAPPTPATEAYVARIREIAGLPPPSEAAGGETPGAPPCPPRLYLFVAHQYTRYLGDLFGGQMMGGMASRSMGLPRDGSGTAFYAFEGVPSTRDFITEWYATLNSLGVPAEQQRAIVDEANLVFDLNIGILEELEGSPWAALWTMVASRAKEFGDWKNIKESKNR